MRRRNRWLVLAALVQLACGPMPPSASASLSGEDGGVLSKGGGPAPGVDGGPGGTPDGGPGGSPDTGTPFRLPPLQTEVPHFELRIPEETLEAFARDPHTDVERPATFLADGRSYPVGVRPRGGSSRTFPKRSWRVVFPEGTRFDGRRKLNLVGMMQDRTMMAEKLAFDLLLAMGAPAPRTRYVRLTLNGRYQGVYVDIERVDTHFARNHGLVDEEPVIYRCGAKDCEMKTWRSPYQQGWQKETHEEERSLADVEALMDVVNHTPEPQLARALEEHLELGHYLRAMAMDALVANNIVEDSQSYLLRDRVTGRWTYVPWDLNNGDARWWPTYGLGAQPPVDHPLFTYSLTDGRTATSYARRRDDPSLQPYLPAFSNLHTRIAFHPALRERLLALVERGLDELYAEDVIFPRIDAMYALIAPHMASDPYVLLDTEGRADPDGLAKFREGPRFLKAFVTRRTGFVRAELERYRTRELGLALHAVAPREGWVELRNHGDEAVSTAGMVLTANVRCAIAELASHPLCVGKLGLLPARTLAPGEVVRFTARELGLTVTPVGRPDAGGAPGLPREGEVGLFTGTSVVGVRDVLFYGELPEGRRYERDARQPTTWRVR